MKDDPLSGYIMKKRQKVDIQKGRKSELLIFENVICYQPQHSMVFTAISVLLLSYTVIYVFSETYNRKKAPAIVTGKSFMNHINFSLLIKSNFQSILGTRERGRPIDSL